MKKVWFRHILLGFLLFSLISIVQGRTYYLTRPSYFPSKSGSYITFDTSLLPLSFNTLYRDSQTRWHFDNYWLRTTTDMTITAWFSSNWFKYATSGGTQEIYVHNKMKPTTVYFDGAVKYEGDGWTYSDRIVTVTPSGTDVALQWEQMGYPIEEEEEPIEYKILEPELEPLPFDIPRGLFLMIVLLIFLLGVWWISKRG